MNFHRIFTMLRARWRIVLLGAMVAGVIGALITLNVNNNIQPRWRAEAPVAFARLDEEAASVVDVGSELTRSRLLLEGMLLTEPGLSIEVDEEENLLLFVAVGSTSEDALDAVSSLRGEYQALGATVLSIRQIEATMAAVLVDIDRLKGQIAEIDPVEAEAEDPAIVAQRTALDSQIEDLNRHQAQLGIWLRNPELRPTEDEFAATKITQSQGSSQSTEAGEELGSVIVTPEILRAERTTTSVVLGRLGRDLAALAEPPGPQELDGETALRLEALQLDITDLEEQYIDLLRRGDAKPLGGFFVEPATTDATASEHSLIVSGLIGFLVGGLLTSAGLIRLDQMREPIWAATDIKGILSLGVVSRDRTDELPDRVWYPSSLSQRRRDIQALRAATDALTGEQPAIVAFSGAGVASDEVGKLAGDLATAYAVAGREVLLIDADAFHPNSLPEFGSHADGLNDILATQMPRATATDAINQMLDDSPPVMAGLTALRVDEDMRDPIDAFASPNYHVLMDIVRSRFDIVILAGPDVTGPLSDAVILRVDFVVLVASLGTTTKSRIAAMTNAFASRRAELAGVVLLTGRHQSLSSDLRAIRRGNLKTSSRRAGQRVAQVVKRQWATTNTPHDETESVAEPEKPQPDTDPNSKPEEPLVIAVDILEADSVAVTAATPADTSVPQRARRSRTSERSD